MKLRKFASVSLILVIVILGVVGFFGYKYYLTQISQNKAKSILALSLSAPVSSKPLSENQYRYKWDAITKTVVISDKDNTLATFKIKEEPEQVMYYPSLNIVALVTIGNDKISHLYIFKDNELTNIYSGSKVDQGVEDFPTSLGGIGFSPDGKYLTFNEYFWETANSHIYSTQNLKEIIIDGGQHTFWYTFWHPNSKCLVNVVEPGMYEGAFDIYSISGNSAKLASADVKDFMLDSLDEAKTTIWWSDDCSGIAKIGYDKEYNDSPDAFYKFNSKSATFKPANSKDTTNFVLFDSNQSGNRYEISLYLKK